MADIGSAFVDGIDLGLIDVEAEDGDIGFRKAEPEGETYLTEADNSNFNHKFP
jgi:hypothetical protein